MAIARRLVLAATLSLTLSSCNFAEASGLADRAVEQFHTQYAAEQWSAMYDAADPGFRRATSAADWSALMAAVRRKLGAFQSTSRGNVNVVSGTGGTTVAQSFDTTFTDGHATEQFRWVISDGRAVLLGYNISSPLLITR